MSTTVSKHQNFIGGEWVDATGGETMEVLNPATGETIAEVPRSSAADVDRAVQAAKKALPDWLETTPGERAEMLLKLADTLERARRRDRRARVAERRQAALVCEGRDSGRRRQHPLLRGRRAPAGRQVRRRVHARLHLVAPPRADRNRRRYRALELPADDGGLEARACSGRGQRPGSEAVRADAADDSAIRTVRRGHPAARRAERRHRRRCACRRGDRQASGCPARVADRRRRDRQDHRANGGGHAEARPPRARRQGARGRVRRRGSRSRRRGDQDRRLLELGPGLHRGLACRRRSEDLRPAARGARPRRRVAARRRPGGGRRDRDGPGDLEVAAGTRARLPRPCQEGHRPHRRRVERRAAASSSSRPSWSTSARRTRSSSARSSVRS